MSAQIWHPLTGNGYYVVNDEALEAELTGAEISELNSMFGGFVLLLGYRDKAFSANGKIAEPFVCIMNNTPGMPHLFLTQE